MNLKHKILFKLFLLLLLTTPILVSAQPGMDILPVIKLTAGQTDSLLITDMFYSGYYTAEFQSTPNVRVLYKPASRYVFFTPSKNFEGLDRLKFILGNVPHYFFVESSIKLEHTFKYKPQGSPKKVNLFGTFNSWNRESIPMSDKDGNGMYEVTIPLNAGLYEYKFFVDGIEIEDPNNPDQKPNGIGGINSIIVIQPRHAEKHYLHLLGKKKEDHKLILSFYYENENLKEPLTAKNVFALWNNRDFIKSNVVVNGNNIDVMLNNVTQLEECVVRVAISYNGAVSNLQTVRTKNGDVTDTDKTWNDAIIYSLMIDRFNDGDKSNSIPVKNSELSDKGNYMGGDLQGILNKIEEGYFDALNINTLWISPVIDNPNEAYEESPEPHRYYSGYHGYWPISSTEVEEKFGTMDLLKKVVTTAHKHDIKILLDFVSNHVHIEHPFWKEHRDWFGVLELPDGRKNLRLWDEQRLTTWFEPYLPSFDYIGSKDALETMTDNAVWWLKETGADGFRHDAVKHVPNEFWRLLTQKIKKEIEIPENKVVYQIGETFGGYDLISSYVNNGQLSAQFNFNLYDTAIPVFISETGSFKTLDTEMKKTFSVYGVNHIMGNIMDSHDKMRYMAFADGDVPLDQAYNNEIGWNNPPQVDNKESYEKEKLYLAYLLTIPGIPIIYYGDEIGMTGASDPDNRRMMRFGNELTNWEKEMLPAVERIIKLRKENSALRHGDFLTLLAEKDLYAYIRSDMNERLLVVLNKGIEAANLKLQLPAVYELKEAVNLTDNKNVEINSNTLNVDIPAVGFAVYKLK
ncbi:MAG: alpha-glucosidase C-terminal domain-containing protein [Ignavibacteriaceae bacterium]|nr:alpha-glucosidase C-terminal domain-containing protein [Ignavibacteriaceae bacterium]